MRTKPLSEITKTICENLNICMRVTNTRQDTLAKAIGASRSSMSRFTIGQCIPKPEQILAICEYFDISIDELYGRLDLVVLTNEEKIFYNYIISNNDNLDKIKKSIDSIDLSTDLKRYIKFNIKNNPDELKKLLEQ
jgi:DNA-binding XRE family transcriptional regulator